MKLTFLLLIVLGSASALGQVASVQNSQPQMLYLPDHPQHAEQHAMASERPLVGSRDTYSYAQGERPLWEFGPYVETAPLGDVARAYRKEKQAYKKAAKVLEKQGS